MQDMQDRSADLLLLIVCVKWPRCVYSSLPGNSPTSLSCLHCPAEQAWCQITVLSTPFVVQIEVQDAPTVATARVH